MRRSAAALALAAACLAGCSDYPQDEARPPAPAPPTFLGIVVDDAIAGSAAYRDAQIRRQRRLGVGVVRQTFDWSLIERRPGRFSLGRYDRYVAGLAAQGMRVLPVLFNPPPFESSGPQRGGGRGTYPPADPASMGRFAAVLVRRYGPRGTLWRERPALQRVPIRSWQVWNEPNLPVFWASGPDPAAYVRLLRATGRAIERVDPRAEIVGAGLADSSLGVPFARYAAQMYEAGARGAADVFAVNAFAPDVARLLGTVRGVRAFLDARGDHVPIWVTEFGWASGGPRSAYTTSEPGQARRVGGAVRALIAARRELGLRGIVYYNWRDARPFPGGREFFGLHTGLLRLDGSAKPALGAFRRSARLMRPR